MGVYNLYPCSWINNRIVEDELSFFDLGSKNNSFLVPEQVDNIAYYESVGITTVGDKKAQLAFPLLTVGEPHHDRLNKNLWPVGGIKLVARQVDLLQSVDSEPLRGAPQCYGKGGDEACSNRRNCSVMGIKDLKNIKKNE